MVFMKKRDLSSMLNESMLRSERFARLLMLTVMGTFILRVCIVILRFKLTVGSTSTTQETASPHTTTLAGSQMPSIVPIDSTISTPGVCYRSIPTQHQAACFYFFISIPHETLLSTSFFSQSFFFDNYLNVVFYTRACVIWCHLPWHAYNTNSVNRLSTI